MTSSEWHGSRGAVMPRHAGFMIGSVLVAALLFTAALSFVWTPHSAIDIDVPAKLQAPSSTHWLGTDSLGRDIASLLIVGTQNSIAVGVIAVGIGMGLMRRCVRCEGAASA